MGSMTSVTTTAEFEELLRERGLQDFTVKQFRSAQRTTFRVVQEIDGEQVWAEQTIADNEVLRVDNAIDMAADEIVRNFETYKTEQIEWNNKAVLVNVHELWADCLTCGASASIDASSGSFDHGVEIALIALLRNECGYGCPNNPTERFMY